MRIFVIGAVFGAAALSVLSLLHKRPVRYQQTNTGPRFLLRMTVKNLKNGVVSRGETTTT